MTDINTIPRQIRASAEKYGSAEALSDGDVSFTFVELAEDTLTIARSLAALGIVPGDRVALWSPNSHYITRMILGILSAGAIVVPINTRYKGAEARDHLSHTSAKAVMTNSGFLGFDYRAALFAEVEQGEEVCDISSLQVVIELGTSSVSAHVDHERVLGWEEFIARADATPREQAIVTADAVKPDDFATILFTSGTTGRSKGVTGAHGPALDLYRNYADIWGLKPGDRYLHALPMFHAGGVYACILTSLIQGVTGVPMAVFDTVEMMKIIERERISVMNGPPTIIYSILDHPDRPSYDLTSLRTMATGAAVVPVAMVERAQAELPFEHFITAYGMTECYGTATMCRQEDTKETVANTNGRPLPNVTIRIVDEDGNELPPGESGEVLIRAPSVTPGYWHAEEETAHAIVDGWLHTGDIGSLDEAGNLKITDRLKDLFLVGGFNVSPAEIEQLLARHPAVGEVSVIGVPDDRLGEVARAYVIAKDGIETTEVELIAWCRERIANFKVPRSVVFIDALPRTASGKVLKIDLRASLGTAPASAV